MGRRHRTVRYTAVERDVVPAQIVGQNQHHIRWPFFGAPIQRILAGLPDDFTGRGNVWLHDWRSDLHILQQDRVPVDVADAAAGIAAGRSRYRLSDDGRCAGHDDVVYTVELPGIWFRYRDSWHGDRDAKSRLGVFVGS